jgi:hypothetical protein
MLSENFSWGAHVNYICCKVSKKLGLFYKTRSKFNRKVLIRFYFSTIRPIIEYGSTLYNNLTVKDENKIENLQRRAAIICTGALPRTETIKLMEDLGWETLKNRRIKAKLCLFYKIHHGLVLRYICDDLLKFKRNLNIRSTRNTELADYTIPFCNTSKFKLSFFPSTVELWIGLDFDARCLDSLSKFKNYLNKKYDFDDRIFDYNLFDVPGSRMLMQFRMGLSNLCFHMFTYNLGENPFCSYCLDEPETIEHFLFYCPRYSVMRNVLFNKLSLFFPEILNMPKKDALQICLRGERGLNFDANFNILRVVSEFILATKRFI